MAVRADASKMKRKLRNLIAATGSIDSVEMLEAADDVVDAIAVELRAVDTSTQVGFDEQLFISNLRATIRKDTTGAWTIDPWEAGGDQNDLDRIAGRGGPFDLGGRASKSLWHMGKKRTDAFFRLIYNNAQARADLARLRQGVWGNTTPQWYLIEFGSIEGQQTPTHFIEKALSKVPLTRLYTSIKKRLQQGYR
jgi:hypothetical protein